MPRRQSLGFTLMLFGGFHQFAIETALRGGERFLQPVQVAGGGIKDLGALPGVEAPSCPVCSLYGSDYEGMEKQNRRDVLLGQNQRFNHAMHRLAPFETRYLRYQECRELSLGMMFAVAHQGFRRLL